MVNINCMWCVDNSQKLASSTARLINERAKRIKLERMVSNKNDQLIKKDEEIKNLRAALKARIE